MRSRAILDHEWVSQRVYLDEGDRLMILNAPRPKDDDRLSVTVGRLSPAEMYKRVRLQARTIPPCERDGVRHAKVGDLRDAGFNLIHAPSNRNPDHATVACEQEWDEQTEEKFHGCFGDLVWHYEHAGGER